MRLPKRPMTKLKTTLIALTASFLGTVTPLVPVMAVQDGGTTQSATTRIQLYLIGKKTAGDLSVPLDDGVTALKDIEARCHYGQAYAVKWTLRKGGTTVDTRATTISTTSLSPFGHDTWNIDLETVGAGYGDYELTCVVEGTAKDTNTSSFRYVPIKFEETEKTRDGQPKLELSREISLIDKVRFTIRKSGRSDIVIVKNQISDSAITLSLSDYDLPTGNYTIIAEGGRGATWLGNTYQATTSYTKPAGSGTPSMDGERGVGVVGVAAAGAVITGASTSKKKRNRN